MIVSYVWDSSPKMTLESDVANTLRSVMYTVGYMYSHNTLVLSSGRGGDKWTPLGLCQREGDQREGHQKKKKGGN